VDDAAWAALTLSLTVLGGIWTWLAFRRHGAVAAMRALGFTLLPLAAYLTKTLQMFTHIVNAVTDWATHLVFSPVVWFGVLLGGVGIVLIVVSGMVRSRRLGTSTDGSAKELPATRGSRSAPVVTETDPELAEIEAILRKRGIS
jgi:hypothetical protein